MCRLDRVLILPGIIQLVPDLCLHALPKSVSDHNPLLLCVDKFNFEPRPFMFFNHWMEDPKFNDLVTSIRKNLRGSGIGNVLKGVKEAIKGWVKENRKHSIKSQIEEAEKRINAL
ncbi:hypothetical protein HRI_000431100 [Hibiscus trionum]|uniref:Uncharacterized protein n=1 Tax=Hibiscus trionum TaxID=183268 RepID=A0A9W7GYQ6_HIBTR|nr:hypothetical protein HRI_000431100 [Hibiscus trionum]